MTAISASTPPKLPVWQTVRASYVIVARNLGQLVRICWVWILIMVPVYAGLDWLDETWSGESSAQATYHWMREIGAALPSLVDLPFLASIAVAWHRLVLREERVPQPAYLRLDGVVWRYVLYAFAFLLLERGTLVICTFLSLNLAIEADPSSWLLIELLAAPAATGAAVLAIGLLVLPRLALVMPATASRATRFVGAAGLTSASGPAGPAFGTSGSDQEQTQRPTRRVTPFPCNLDRARLIRTSVEDHRCDGATSLPD